MSDNLIIAGKEFKSRLILGTGRYRTMEEMVSAVEASGTEMITVALRRLDLDDPDKKTILDYIDWSRYQILPNTAGCRTADEAITIARLARSMGLSKLDKAGGAAGRAIPSPGPGGHAGGGQDSCGRRVSLCCLTSSPIRSWP